MTKRFRPGWYANVTSTLALVVALGGTSYAAFKLPKDSVGGREIKQNAVTSGEVKDGSLLGADFKAGQLRAGPSGEKGDAGAKGGVGANGLQGATGRQGDVGATGQQGATGQKGDVGATGQQGSPGAQGAQGLPGSPGAQGAQGQPGPPGPQGAQGVPGAPATRLFAAVSANGTLGKNSGAASATRTGDGQYSVTFNTNITGCVFLVTTGTDRNASLIPAMYSTFHQDTNVVRVRSQDSSSGFLDQDFNLAAFC